MKLSRSEWLLTLGIIAVCVALVLWPSRARAAGDCVAQEQVGKLMAMHDAVVGPRLVEGSAARRSLNDLFQAQTGEPGERSIVWWGETANGVGLLVLGDAGAMRCAFLVVPPGHWPALLQVILGVPI